MMKKFKTILIGILCLVILTACAPTTIAINNEPVIKISKPAPITIDGTVENVAGFNLNGTNYYHLRSLANAMKDTTGRFNIVEIKNNIIYMMSGYNYTGDKPASPEVTSENLKNGKLALNMNGYNLGTKSFCINDNTFVELRSFSTELGYDIHYDESTNSIKCNTTNSICADIKDKVYQRNFTYDPFTRIDLTMDEVNKIMSHSSISGYGECFYNMQEQYGVNIIFAIAVAYVESGRGKYPCASYNYFGMIGCSYSSPQAGINAFGALMNKSLYYGKSIDQIAPIYCPGGNWASQVKGMMNEIWSYI